MREIVRLSRTICGVSVILHLYQPTGSDTEVSAD